ncbi:MAG: beta-N-acetylglucosaminidase domain-containing protein, partial [Clostridia bacterium]|nr:beta-N-acetylglucosaminidase domain-containing protein [Clostridia bacterium]
MKKLLLLLALLLTVTLCAVSCTGGEVPNDTTDGTTVPQTDAPTEGSETTAAPTEEVTEPDTDPDTQPDDTKPEEIVIPDVYPTPLEITAGDTYVDLSKACLHRYVLLYADELEGKGITFEENGVNIFAEIRDLTEFSYGADEGYILTVNAKGVKIEAQTERGLHYAIMTLLQLTEDGKCPAVTVKDAPRNPIRGVIEGFYGTAWTHEYRKDLFKFMGEHKMNAYIYAPKDDPKHRAQWRSLYTGAELERMTDLITTANDNQVKFIYAISPGGDLHLGSGYEADFKKLMAKCEQIYELGCSDLAIFLDDIPTLDAEGHAKLLNDFQTRFVETHEGVSDLIAITTEDGDPFLTNYPTEIAPLIHKDVVLMWTGPGVIP